MNDFTPDWLCHPCETIRDSVNHKNITTVELAKRMSLPINVARMLLRGQVPISETLAARLANAIGCTPKFWLARQHNFDASVARLIDAQ